MIRAARQRATSRWLLGCILSTTWLGLSAKPAHAILPDDPKVQAMVEKGVAYLEKADTVDGLGQQLGGQCLRAMAIYKHRGNSADRHVQSAVQACQNAVRNSANNRSGEFNYSLGIAIIFLCELDPQTYANEIKGLVQMMRDRQRPDGAWSYPDYKTGDTSQTQYGVLSSWIAHKRGAPAEMERVERFCNWLIRTQDPNGSFAYQGTDPGHSNRVPQPDFRYTMAPAAMGALYISADLLGIPLAEESGKDAIFRKLTAAGPNAGGAVDPALLKKAIRDGNAWYDREFKIDLGNNHNQFYYLYSVERYQSFREKLEKLEIKEPKWYTDGVDYLARTQAEDGSWADDRGPIISTAFACLFLIRATQKAIAAEGNLIGGYGLPEDLTKIRLEDGQIVSSEVKGDLGSLMELLQSGETLDSEALFAQVDHIKLDPKKPRDSSQLDELKKQVAGGTYQARLLAVRALGNSGDIKNGPVLIYALSDPDWRVAKEARDSLRLISRRLTGFGMPDKPSPAQQLAEQRAWRDWLQSVRPDISVPDEVFVTPQP